MLHHALSFIWKIGSNDVRQGIALYNVLILPTALWILRFKRNDFFFLFPWSVFSERGNEDKSFLVKGKALRGRRGVVEATGELLLSTANPRREVPLLFSPSLLPFLPLSVSTPAFFSTVLFYPLLCWSIGCSLLLYKYIATSSGGGGEEHPCSRSILSLWTYTSSIRYHRLVCSFQYESLNDASWRQPPHESNNTRAPTTI